MARTLTWSLDGDTLSVENRHYGLTLALSRGVHVDRWWDADRKVDLVEPGSLVAPVAVELGGDRPSRPIGTANLGSLRNHRWRSDRLATLERDEWLRVSLRLIPELSRAHCSIWINLEFSSSAAWHYTMSAETGLRSFQGRLSFPLLAHAVRYLGEHSLLSTSLFQSDTMAPVSLLDGRVLLYAGATTDARLPSCVWSVDTGSGFYVDLLAAGFKCEPVPAVTLADAHYPIAIGDDDGPVVKVELGICHDWKEMYQPWRERLRSRLDTNAYERPEQEWYRRLFSCAFVFVFDKSVYDPGDGGYLLLQHLDQLRLRFGGLDAFIFWNSFPKLGIDERDQFELFDDLPGGRQALRGLFEEAKEHNIRPFVAYIPWDCADPTTDHAAELARLVGELSADGIHLDTMSLIHPSFREELDRQGGRHVVYMPEIRPALSPTMSAVNESTGSWAQGFPKTMPSVDLFRFTVPEHKVFIVDRDARNRSELIKCALFNGNGVILWDRNFAVPAFNYAQANDWSDEDACLIKRCHRIWQSYGDAFATAEPEPLIASATKGLWVNKFPAAGGILYTLYNDSGADYAGPLFEVGREDADRWLGSGSLRTIDVWNEPSLIERALRNGSTVIGSIGNRDVGCVVVEG